MSKYVSVTQRYLISHSSASKREYKGKNSLDQTIPNFKTFVIAETISNHQISMIILQNAFRIKGHKEVVNN